MYQCIRQLTSGQGIAAITGTFRRTADIQSGVEKGACGDVGAEESTIRRWQAWFAAILSAIVSMQIHEDEIRGMETGMNDAYNRYRELHGPFWLVFFIKYQCHCANLRV